MYIYTYIYAYTYTNASDVHIYIYRGLRREGHPPINKAQMIAN